MDFQKSGPRRGIKKFFFLSLVLHIFLGIFLFFEQSSDSLRPAGVAGKEGVVEISVVSTSIAPDGSAALKTSAVENNAQNGEKGAAGESGEEGTSEVLHQIRKKIERAKYYPLMAKRSQTEGSPLVEFKINQDGSLAYIQLKKSSGSPILDEAAIKTVHNAAPFPFYPEPIALHIVYALGL